MTEIWETFWGRGRHKPRGRSAGIECPAWTEWWVWVVRSEQSDWKGKLPVLSSKLLGPDLSMSRLSACFQRVSLSRQNTVIAVSVFLGL